MLLLHDVMVNPQSLQLYSIDFNKQGTYIEHVLANFKFDTTIDSNQPDHAILGKANLQILTQSLPTNMSEYILSIRDIPAELISKFAELATAYEFFIKPIQKDPTQRIAVLHHIDILPAYRGNRLSYLFLWLLLKGLKESYKADLVFLQACPLEVNKEDKKAMVKEKQRLEKIYSRAGFQMITDHHLNIGNGLKIHYMFLDLRKRNFDSYRLK